MLQEVQKTEIYGRPLDVQLSSTSYGTATSTIMPIRVFRST